MNNPEVKTINEINIPYPQAGTPNLKLSVGACRLNIKPTDGAAWVIGTYVDPSGALPFRVLQEGDSVRITQEWSLPHTWNFDDPPTFDLALGNFMPYSLTIETGASSCQLELGGLPLTRLEIKHGAGKVQVRFSTPNPQPMTFCEVSSGAGATELYGLANANAAEMNVEGGMAGYVMDFSGELQRAIHVKLQTGLSDNVVIIPPTTAGKVSVDSFMGSLLIGDGFMKKEGAFMTAAAVANQAPVLTMEAKVALGALKLRAAV